VKHQKPTLDGN